MNPERLPVDLLSDEDLDRLNALLPWHSTTLDSSGRLLGRTVTPGKRDGADAIPDPRILRMDERFGLAGRHVLEVGCFEGAHTIALCRSAGRVTAVDSRIENVAKTLVRCAMYGCRPTVLPIDVERNIDSCARMRPDLVHHVGVLYHLQDPARHLRALGRVAGRGLMLDTHFARAEDATETYRCGWRRFRFRPHKEGGRDDPFSGMRDGSRWLLLDDIVSVLGRAGFDRVDVAEVREERNGPRALIFAERGSRSPGSSP